MKISVEISFYPLVKPYVPPIKDFIERLNLHQGIVVKTNGMSTQIFGEYDLVMDILRAEIAKSFEQPYSAFVFKIINADLNHADDSQ